MAGKVRGAFYHGTIAASLDASRLEVIDFVNSAAKKSVVLLATFDYRGSMTQDERKLLFFCFAVMFV